ncbi:XTP/dITP diphosphohydrolase [Natranaerovirga pectinivora]|uniref:dITP/XTP pyrophosphatase n=1 Tax=Natranaerovirga pectinivora TaxID=682400 RepID=A0A4R3MG57_9FIRM|nr:XTP/dITP diphosphatase [Natranaerovirga pectinivora]TCT12152.1 XTP/dITP diphosphohydrolase [Natranaerovirga pectinivora]
MKYKIIFATKNEGKMKEIRMILEDSNIEIVSLKEAGIDLDVEEDGLTFEENAIKKAKEIMEHTGSIVMADDSGLEVDYMDKKPGVYSARYGGEDTPYNIKNQMILDILKDVPEEKRTARFVSVIATVFPDGKTFTTRGVIEGIIDYDIKGDQGFGYDPIFYVPEYNCTTAEMSPALKNKISHRGKALELMKKELNKYLGEKK